MKIYNNLIILFIPLLTVLLFIPKLIYAGQYDCPPVSEVPNCKQYTINNDLYATNLGQKIYYPVTIEVRTTKQGSNPCFSIKMPAAQVNPTGDSDATASVVNFTAPDDSNCKGDITSITVVIDDSQYPASAFFNETSYNLSDTWWTQPKRNNLIGINATLIPDKKAGGGGDLHQITVGGYSDFVEQ